MSKGIVQRSSEALQAFDKWKKEHPVIPVVAFGMACVGFGWTAYDVSLPWRGKTVIDSSSASPSLTARGLWDNDHPSPKAIELARGASKAGPPAVELLQGHSLLPSDKMALVEAIAGYVEESPRCADLKLKALDAYRKIAGKWGGETYTRDREEFRLLNQQFEDCDAKEQVAAAQIERLMSKGAKQAAPARQNGNDGAAIAPMPSR